MHAHIIYIIIYICIELNNTLCVYMYICILNLCICDTHFIPMHTVCIRSRMCGTQEHFQLQEKVQGDEVRRGSSVLLGLGRAVPSAELQTSCLESLTMSAHRQYSLKSRRRKKKIEKKQKNKGGGNSNFGIHRGEFLMASRVGRIRNWKKMQLWT